MFKDIPTRSSLWGDVKHSSQIFCIEPLNSLSMVRLTWAPIQGGRSSKKSPDYWEYLYPAKPSLGHLWSAEPLQGVGWHRCFWQTAPVPGCCVPCTGLALVDASSPWDSGQEASGSAWELCERCLSIPQLLFHLAGLFLQLAFAGRWFCSAAGRAGWHSVSSTARLFSSHSSSMAHCCFSPSQRFHALLRRGHTCRWAAEPHSWPPSALTCTSKKDGVQMASLVPEITAGHHLASTLVEKLPFGLPFSWYCFGCLCLKGTFKTNTPYAIFPTPVLPLS